MGSGYGGGAVRSGLAFASNFACMIVGALALVQAASAQLVFEVDPERSGVRIDVELSTTIGRDADRDSTGLGGSMSALLVDQTIHLTEGELVFGDDLHLTFSFSPFGSVTADASSDSVGLILITPGPPATLTDGAFLQPANEMALQGVLNLDGTGVLDSAVPDEPEEIDVRSTMQLGGTLTVRDGAYDLELPIDFSGTFDLGSNADAVVTLAGVIHATATSPVAVEVPRPTRSMLHDAYPSPTASTAFVPFELERSGTVHLAVYDVHGRRVADLSRGLLPAGPHEVQIDVSTLPSGVYFVVLTTETTRETTRLVVLR